MSGLGVRRERRRQASLAGCRIWASRGGQTCRFEAIAAAHASLALHREQLIGTQSGRVVVDRARLQAIATEAGHPELVLPQSLDGATVGVQVPRSVQLQYGTCPGPANASKVVADNITGPSPTTTQYSDCVRLREGPAPVVNVPAGLDVGGLAQIGLETAGMTSNQASDLLHTIDWKATLTLAVPRSLRSYQVVKVNGTNGTLLSMAGRRGPGYALIWTKNGVAYSLLGFGDASQAVQLADSLK